MQDYYGAYFYLLILELLYPQKLNYCKRKKKKMTSVENKKPFLGILQVNTSFHRPVGDVGNASTWSIPVRIKIVEDADKEEVVKGSRAYSKKFIETWLKAADELVEEGAVALVTSCGFLATMHPILQKALSVPVGTSALLQVPIAKSLVPPDKTIGILTFDSESLGQEHLLAVGANVNTPIAGVPKNGAFQKILAGEKEFNYEAIKEDIIFAARQLLNEHENIGGLVLECTNMPPYKRALFEEFGLPVWDILTLGNFVYLIGLPEKFI